MVGAIGAAGFYPASVPGGGRSAGGLEAQLARYEHQLSDWTCCDSAKTPAGKRKIQEISDRISDVRTRIAETEAAKRTEREVAPIAVRAAASPPAAAGANFVPGASAVGNFVDVIA